VNAYQEVSKLQF